VIYVVESLSELTPMEQRVFLLLLRIENHRTHEFFHSTIWIGEKLNVCRKSISRALKGLCDNEIIELIGKAGRANRYKIINTLHI